MLWRSGRERGEAGAAPPAGFRREAGGGAAGVVFLVCVPGGEDALVADGQCAGEPEGKRGQSHEPDPAAGDVVAGGVLEGGVGAFGAGAPGVRAAPVRRRIVVFLPGLSCYCRGHGDGLLGAAGRRVLWRGEDLGPVPVQFHGVRAERAADLAGGGRAGDAVVAVGVVGGVPAKLVAGELGGLLVVRGGLPGGRAGRQRREFQQRPGCLRAVQVSVGDDRAVVGALGAAVC